MIYAFCSDAAFAGVGEGSMLSHSEIEQSQLGVLSDQMINYFLTPTVLTDPRSINPLDNDRLVCQPFGIKAAGAMLLNFDNTRQGDGNDYSHIRPVYLKDEDAAVIDSLNATSSYRQAFFCLLEYCFLTHTTAGEVVSLPSVDTIEEYITSHQGVFTGYVAGSLKLSATTLGSKIRLYDNSKGSTVYESEVPFYTSIEFQFNTAAATTPVSFKVWLGMQAFLDEYPLSVLMNVVFPCEPAKLLDMNFTNVITAITESAAYKDEQLATAIKTTDHSGLTSYVSRYVNISVATYYRMPFTILYKGAQPSASDMRTYIREELLDLNLTTETIWKEILPDLFVDGVFYLIPFYNNRVELVDGFTMDKNLVSYKYFQTLMSEMFPNENSDNLLNHGSLLMAAGSGLYIYAYPDSSNEEDLLDLWDVHPTYMNIDATSTYWDLMSDATQDFSQQLALAMSVALGNQANDSGYFTEEVLSQRNFLAFISGSVEYHLLRKDSF